MKAVLETSGYCPVCAAESRFVARHEWLRDHFLCTRCKSIPRQRALMRVIETFFPGWRDLAIHESSPGARGASARLARECRGYVPSWFFPGRAPGSVQDGRRCEDLERLSFPDAAFDLHVTQDVMEHIFHPTLAFRELARTLKPGGAHVFTVPLVRKQEASRRRARMAGGKIQHLVEPPEYHDDPTSKSGALVTFDWGYDICARIFRDSGLFTQIVHLDDLSMGIRAEYIEVLVTQKPRA